MLNMDRMNTLTILWGGGTTRKGGRALGYALPPRSPKGGLRHRLIDMGGDSHGK